MLEPKRLTTVVMNRETDVITSVKNIELNTFCVWYREEFVMTIVNYIELEKLPCFDTMLDSVQP